MTRILLDTTTLEKLHHLREPLELCDESGQVLAHLTPTGNADASARESSEPLISIEEVQRRKQNKINTKTTDEVLAYLRTR
jgi:hypothetical protein